MLNPDDGDMLKTQALAEASFYPKTGFLNQKRDSDVTGEDLDIVHKYFKELSAPTGETMKRRSHRRSKSTFQTTYNNNEDTRGTVTRDESELLSRMLNIIKRYEVGVLKLNRLRFEA
jgi:hypothetical protein